MRIMELMALCVVIVLIHTSIMGAETMPYRDIPEDEFANMKIVNVRDYGAAGDGITDDTAAIQAAIDAAKGTGQKVTTVFIPAGNYRLTDEISIDRRVNIQGTGVGSQIYQSADEHLFSISPFQDGGINGTGR